MADSEIEIFGDGEQARSFLYIEDCMDAVEELMLSDFTDPINIGSDRTITINDLADMIINISRKNINVNHIDGPVGVPARTSDNTLFDEVIGEKHNYSLEEGIEHCTLGYRVKCNDKQSDLIITAFFDILLTRKEGNGDVIEVEFGGNTEMEFDIIFTPEHTIMDSEWTLIWFQKIFNNLN